MRKILLTITMLLFAIMINAQSEVKQTINTADDAEVISLPANSEVNNSQLSIAADESNVKAMVSADDTTALKSLNIPTYGITRPWLFTMWMPTSPFNYGYGWDLHEGLNGQIGMGVMVGFGKYNPFKGASFFTDASLVYAREIDKHWSVALGGTLSRFKMWDKNEWATQVFGIANYKFDNHWSASVYASYNHMPHGMGMYGLYAPFDMMYFNQNFARIGGEVTYRFNNNCSISVGVSSDIPVGEQRPWMPQRPTNIQDNRMGR